ncbi:AraC-like DNA-binding protein [Paraburkholderia unamae]|uniref:AraC-like DNA-binding protein n=1 Tax=Paraburkholderia unamae TaxID=219649 RepID=A0ABX5KTA6_9BURK|nr:AraC-like DNA-binding protein [Paraburkholderia unamae]
MTQSAWTRDGRPVDAAAIPRAEWEALKQFAQLGDFMMPCCKAPAVLKTSINGLPFFAHLSDECPLEFGSDFNGLVCATADLDYPNPAADPELARYAEDLADSQNVEAVGSTALEVRKAIYLLLPLGQASVEQVAAHLHMSVRTMQRQLDLANTSFSRVTEGVRYELAVRFMSNSRFPIGQVSGLVGYSHRGRFTNWFVGRFGMTPRDWRFSRTRPLCN